MIRQQIKDFTYEASYQRVEHRALLPFDATLDDLLTPGYWGTVVNQLKVGDKIECYRADYSLYVEVVVTHVERGLANVSLIAGKVDSEVEAKIKALRTAKADTTTPKAPELNVPAELSDYKIGFAAGSFYVQFKPSHETIATKLPSKQAAIDYALAHRVKTMGTPA